MPLLDSKDANNNTTPGRLNIQCLTDHFGEGSFDRPLNSPWGTLLTSSNNQSSNIACGLQYAWSQLKSSFQDAAEPQQLLVEDFQLLSFEPDDFHVVSFVSGHQLPCQFPDSSTIPEGLPLMLDPIFIPVSSQDGSLHEGSSQEVEEAQTSLELDFQVSLEGEDHVELVSLEELEDAEESSVDDTQLSFEYEEEELPFSLIRMIVSSSFELLPLLLLPLHEVSFVELLLSLPDQLVVVAPHDFTLLLDSFHALDRRPLLRRRWCERLLLLRFLLPV